MVKSHMLYLCLSMYRRRVEAHSYRNERTKHWLLHLAKVFCLKQLTLDCQPCYESGFFQPGASELLSEGMAKALAELRPMMVPLVELEYCSDADMSYLSAIGNEYGDIYETQLKWAMESRLNRQPVPAYFNSVVKPMFNWEKL